MSYTPGLTDTELRATPVPVSGTVTVQDGGNVISVDDAGGSLTVDGTVAATQSGTWTVQPGNTANTTAWKVDASSVAVPVTDNGGNLSIDDGGNSITVDGPLTDVQLRASAVPISAAALPLPSGAATESTLTGVLTTSDFDTKTGSLTEAAPATDTASSGLNGRLQRIAQRITSLIALVPAALTGSGNFKVSLAESTASQAVTNANLDAGLSTLLTTSDFDTKTGSLTEAAPATDTASSGLNGRLQRIAQRITSLIALVPAALTGSGNFKVSLAESTASQAVTNANLDAGLSTLLTTSDFDTKTGSLTEAAPATDTASSGLNGRLQRIAQRITSLIALLPSALISGRLDVNLGAAPATVTIQDGSNVISVDDAAGSLTIDVPDGSDSTLGAKADAAATTDTGTFSLVALFKRLLTKWLAEDAGHTSADPGLMLLTVRNDALAANGLAGTDLDYQALQSNNQGDLRCVGPYPVLVSGTLTRPANTTPYASGDEMTDTSGNILAISGCARYNGGSGWLESVHVINNQAEATPATLDMYVLDTTSTPTTDNGATAFGDAASLTIVYATSLGTPQAMNTATGGNQAWQKTGLHIPFTCGASSTSLFVRFVLRAAFTANANSSTFTVRLGTTQN